MIGSPDRRLSRLEATTSADTDFPLIFVSFQGAAGYEPHKATLDGRVWHRADAETGEAFQDRVGIAVGAPDQPWGTVVFLD